MKVLYISRLEGHKWQGPTHSVPMQIKHQAEIDEVLWINLCSSIREEWKELPYYLEPKSEMGFCFNDLPVSFGKPDLVVFEGVYEYPFLKFVFELWKRNVPYVIVPRSALTFDAQNKKKLKKWIGNFVFFRRFIKRAAAIHYLTLAEEKDSQQWETPSFIAPNGILPKDSVKCDFSKNGRLIWSYVGRVEKYQKGLDLLIEACAKTAKELRENGVEIHLYGPDREGSFSSLLSEIQKFQLSDLIFLHDGVFGEEKERVLLESDAFIMTSRFEGLPMGMIEALAYGAPVLATKGTNLTEEIKAVDAGWTSDNTVDGIAEMFLQMLREKDCLAQKGENAKKLSQNYAWDSIAKQTHEEYRSIVSDIGTRY